MNELEKRLKEISQKDDEKVKIECIMICLSGITIEEIKDFGQYDFFLNLAKKFISDNTDEDVNNFINHHIAVRLILMFRK